ncbi:TPA: hypothetical protein ACH3X1_009214 [Trebouxia sp. C0004]
MADAQDLEKLAEALVDSGNTLEELKGYQSEADWSYLWSDLELKGLSLNTPLKIALKKALHPPADHSPPQPVHSQPAVTTLVPVLPGNQTAAQPSVAEPAVDPNPQDAQSNTASPKRGTKAYLAEHRPLKCTPVEAAGVDNNIPTVVQRYLIRTGVIRPDTKWIDLNKSKVMEDVRNQLRLEHVAVKNGTYNMDHLDFKLRGIVARKAKELRRENGSLRKGK